MMEKLLKLHNKKRLFSKSESVPPAKIIINPDRYYSDYTIQILKSNFEKKRYNYKGREKKFMEEMIQDTKLPIQLKFVNDGGGHTGLTTIHTKTGMATIELFNWIPSISGIETFLHELAHAIDGISYWKEYNGDISKLQEHGKSWKNWAVKLGAIPEKTLSTWEEKNGVDFI